jgi:outer membrane protein OmpA-like peptidoglycan-associated protein
MQKIRGMKNFYQFLTKLLVLSLVLVIASGAYAQQAKKVEPKKDTVKAAKKGCEQAPCYKYWYATIQGGANQFNGDLSKNPVLNDKWMFGAGAMMGKSWTRVWGTRLRIGWAPLSSEVKNKFIPNNEGGNSQGGYVSQKFTSYVIEGDAQATINWLNWILGYKPERLFSSYLIAGIGMDHTQGSKYDLLQGGKEVGYLGYPDHKGADWGYDAATGSIGNHSGIGSWNLEFKVTTGIGFDFNLSKHWSLNPEFVWRWRDGDVLDLTKGGAKAVKNDMYSGGYLGLTYKFGYKCCDIKVMEKNYSQVKYETTPKVLEEKGDSVMVTVKGTFPPKWFCPKVVMVFEPKLTYAGGSYTLKPMTFHGEEVTGDGTMIKYKEGGSFTYTTTFPYKPEMKTSMLVVAPIIYQPKDKKVAKPEDIKNQKDQLTLPSRDLAPGVIYTPTRAMMDQAPLIADHGYQKEVLQSKTATLHFPINLFKLDMKFGINKTPEAQKQLSDLNDFIKQGWKIKDITINGWASPDGEETFNIGLSENRAKTGNKYMIDQFQGFVKEAQKDNKDKKAVKTMVDAAGKDVNFVIDHHGPDWNGFMKEVQGSNVKDRDKILNVINSSGDNKKKEQEIRNMVLIYPELEKDMLPRLRRAEITANLYEPRKTDDELSKLAISNPDQLKVEELLYAATLTTNNDTKLTIYDNAARLYPNNWKALNNAAYANILKGNNDKAATYLTKAQGLAPNTGVIENNIGVVAAKTGDLKKAETQFKKAQQLGEKEDYNLGVLMIPKGDYQKAQTMMANAKCTYNLGLAQLVGGNMSAAQTTLQCAPQNPETYYLLAITGARTNNTKMLYDNLVKAVVDPKLKEDARGDREFYNYANTQDFKNIVK